MRNYFEIIGLPISYGIILKEEWIDVKVDNETLSIFLKDGTLGKLESNYDLYDCTISAKGYIANDGDYSVKLIADEIEVLEVRPHKEDENI